MLIRSRKIQDNSLTGSKGRLKNFRRPSCCKVCDDVGANIVD
ncbi:hypothetical protein HMPREF1051_2608 [Neisseria sicca VK64]|uniref:Uncharacterized protein n=1 Tax=Neisseria sicca VK64 TaxID=1095748 RepID=I2NWG1_NEISI|nr:hypothetical protein HMPREF1051_2608 [Neisseria sicca VK64]